MGPALLADFQFFLLDNRRSSRDGEELKRVVVAYPAVPRVSDLLWAAGLHSGTAAFARTFGEVGWVVRCFGRQEVEINSSTESNKLPYAAVVWRDALGDAPGRVAECGGGTGHSARPGELWL